jgi:hypothetical protein
MGDPFANRNVSKAEGAADAINSAIRALIRRATKGPTIKDIKPWWDVCIIGYGFEDKKADYLLTPSVQTLQDLAGNNLGEKLIPKGTKDEFGRTSEADVKVPIWVRPNHVADTPMCAALDKAEGLLIDWTKNHPDSRPPVVVNITDGEANDGEPEEKAKRLTDLKTSNGNVLLWNCHLTSEQIDPVVLPSDDGFPGLSSDALALAQKMFRMSSLVPEFFMPDAKKMNPNLGPNPRGLVYNSNPIKLLQIIEMGSRTGK